MHTPNGNIPTVAAFFRQSGLLLDHPSSMWNPARVKQFHYTNPHNPPPGGHVRMFDQSSQGRLGYSGPGGSRWTAPAVTGKSVEVQRSQVDELFKSMIDQDNLAEYDPGERRVTWTFGLCSQLVKVLALVQGYTLTRRRPLLLSWSENVRYSDRKGRRPRYGSSKRTRGCGSM